MSQSETPDPREPVRAGAPRSARRPALVALAGALVVGAAAGALVISGALGDGSDGSDPATTPAAGTTPGPAASSEEAEEAEVPGVTVGTPENPYGPGDTFVILDDWTMTIGETDTDSWPELEPQLQQTSPSTMDWYPPEPGMVYVSAPSSIVYNGDTDDQDRLNSITVSHLAADGTTTAINTCGRYGMAVETYWPGYVNEDPSAEGVPCVEIPPSQVAGGQWQIFIDWIGPDGRPDYVLVHYTAV
ncbi:hypothetical protein [Sanguibacter suaedae]|uniref:Uncharacterized protein n=1 Tax=Sanguibacter suaedae TaxID=2795737 RepID=A0A934IBZ7_9MICO|nr:hypothetical protein [Sanguibacter suaedae]MBI9115880.1 hypothetical protein [Sanguibacter suaedae]